MLDYFLNMCCRCPGAIIAIIANRPLSNVGKRIIPIAYEVEICEEATHNSIQYKFSTSTPKEGNFGISDQRVCHF